jgi:nitroreductase
MEFFEVVKKRRSIRRFQPREVEQEAVKKILEAAIEAPSAGNLQTWRFWVVLSEELKRRLAQAAYYQDFVAEAPVVIVVGADLERAFRGYGERGQNLYALQDTAAAVENILLAACALGLGSCWVGAFDEEAVSEALSLPSSLRPVAIVPIGYPASEGRKPPRRPLEEVATWRE